MNFIETKDYQEGSLCLMTVLPAVLSVILWRIKIEKRQI